MTPAPSAQVVSARQLLGKSVFGPDGEKVGEIADVGLDADARHILFATVASGGFLGLGTRRRPVPWSELEYDPERDCCRVRLTRQELRTPDYD